MEGDVMIGAHFGWKQMYHLMGVDMDFTGTPISSDDFDRDDDDDPG